MTLPDFVTILSLSHGSQKIRWCLHKYGLSNFFSPALPTQLRRHHLHCNSLCSPISPVWLQDPGIKPTLRPCQVWWHWQRLQRDEPTNVGNISHQSIQAMFCVKLLNIKIILRFDINIYFRGENVPDYVTTRIQGNIRKYTTTNKVKQFCLTKIKRSRSSEMII